MSTPPVAHILFGVNSIDLPVAFKDSTTFSQLRSKLDEKENIFLFDNVNNPNFLSLEHSVNFGGEEEKGYLKLQFIDPTDEFTEKFIDTGFVELLSRVDTQPSELLPWDPAFVNKGTSVFDLEEILGQPEEARQASKQILTGVPESSFASDIILGKKLKAQQDAQVANLITRWQSTKDQLIGNIVAPGRRRFYVAYGVGENLSSWAGPYLMFTSMVEFDYTAEGAKVFTLYLVPDSSEYSNIRGRAPYREASIHGVGKLVQAINILDDLNLYKDNPVYPRSAAHTSVKKMLKKYLTAATGSKNIILLIPDLDRIAKKLEKTYEKEFSKLDTKISKAEYFWGRFTEDMGMHFHIKMRVGKESDTKTIPGATTEVGYLIVTQQHSNAKKLKSDFDGEGRKAGQVMSNRYVENATQPIEEVKQAIGAHLVGKKLSLEWQLYVENDPEVLAFWRKLTTGTIDEEDFIPIKDKEAEVFVFGDSELIRSLLYGDGLQTEKVLKQKFAHPDDINFFDESYAATMEKILHPTKITFPWGDLFSLPDGFAYIDGSFETEIDPKKKKKEKFKERIPVLRSGVPNANILSLNISSKELFFNALMMSFVGKQLPKQNDGKQTSLKDVFHNFSKTKEFKSITEDIDNFLKEHNNDDEELQDYLTQKLLNLSKGSLSIIAADEFANTFITMYETLRNDDKLAEGAGKIEVVDAEDTSVYSMAMQLAETLYRQAVTLSIKTLPIFNISRMSDLASMRHFLVFIKEAVHSGVTRESPQEFNEFLSGAYRLTGFQHVINNNEVTSSFSLFKSIQNETKKEKEGEGEEKPIKTTPEHPIPYSKLGAHPGLTESQAEDLYLDYLFDDGLISVAAKTSPLKRVTWGEKLLQLEDEVKKAEVAYNGVTKLTGVSDETIKSFDNKLADAKIELFETKSLIKSQGLNYNAFVPLDQTQQEFSVLKSLEMNEEGDFVVTTHFSDPSEEMDFQQSVKTLSLEDLLADL